MSHTVIVAAKRTPIGSFMGALSDTPAPELAAIVIRDLLQANQILPQEIEQVILGQVIQAGTGQSPARQALISAGLKPQTNALTINKVCGSGLKAVMLADVAIRAGEAQVILAGGMENMSLAPYGNLKMRKGLKLGESVLEDFMLKDGLIDPYSKNHMGLIAEKCAQTFEVSRQKQDEYAIKSYTRAENAHKSQRFKNEITPVVIQSKKATHTIDADEELQKINLSKLKELKPAFDPKGTITAANASSLSDGAAVLMLMSESSALQKNLKPIVKITATSEVSQEPDWFSTAPKGAIEKLLKKAGLQINDIDLWEINEAFSVVSVYHLEALKIDPEKCNVNGGAVALGHPLGASGARILVTLIHELEKRPNAKRGVAAVCIGGGEAVAVLVEKP